MAFRSLLNRILPNDRLLPYEQAIVTSLTQVTCSRTSMIIQHQRDEIECIQRQLDGKEVNLYLNDTTRTLELLPSIFPDWPIAIVYCHPSESAVPIRVSIWIAGGKLFSMVFSERPALLASGRASYNPQLLVDPYDEDELVLSYKRVELHALKDIQGHGLAVSHGSFLPPLSPRIRQQFLIPSAAFLPLDYRDLLSHTNGFQCGVWRVIGLPLREVAMERSNVFVLAESMRSQVLCAMDGDTTRHVYLIDLEDDRCQRIGSSFADALATVLPITSDSRE